MLALAPVHSARVRRVRAVRGYAGAGQGGVAPLTPYQARMMLALEAVGSSHPGDAHSCRGDGQLASRHRKARAPQGGLIHTQKVSEFNTKSPLCERLPGFRMSSFCERVAVSSSTGPHRQDSRSELAVSQAAERRSRSKKLCRRTLYRTLGFGCAVALTGSISRDDGRFRSDALRGTRYEVTPAKAGKRQARTKPWASLETQVRNRIAARVAGPKGSGSGRGWGARWRMALRSRRAASWSRPPRQPPCAKKCALFIVPP